MMKASSRKKVRQVFDQELGLADSGRFQAYAQYVVLRRCICRLEQSRQIGIEAA